MVSIRAGYDISDHVPIFLNLRNIAQLKPENMYSRIKVDTRKLKERALDIRLDNRWEVLAQLEDEEDYGELFLRTSQDILADNNCLSKVVHNPSRKSFYKFSSATKTAIRKSKRITMQVRRAQIAGEEISPDVWNQLNEAQKQAKKLRMKDGNKGWTKHLNRGLKPLLEHDHKNIWKWIRSLTTKQQNALPVIPPTRDSQGNMLSDVESIMEATQAHYSTLATDPDPRPIDWWESHCPLESAAVIDELNDEISWMELNSTIHQLKTGKCPGMDKIPNEFFTLARTTHDITEPILPIGAALLRACNAIFSGHFSEAMNTSLMISLPKPGKDFTLLDNRRGISLISCLMKLVTKVIANRIQTFVVNSASGLRKEQAGFRRFEECNAQVATLKDIAARREAKGKPTYVAFMDLQKAFCFSSGCNVF